AIFRDGRWGLFRVSHPSPHVLGLVVPGFLNIRWLRTRLFLMVLGGPLANALILAAVFSWLPPAAMLAQLMKPSPAMLPGLTLAAASALMLLGTLWPMRVKTSGGELLSDGGQLLRIPFLSEEHLQQLHVHYLQ